MSDPFMESIRRARETVVRETVVHEKRMEFWAGYIAALEEVRDHPKEYGLTAPVDPSTGVLGPKAGGF